MFEKIKNAFRAVRNERFLENWAARTDGDSKGRFYVKRRFEAGPAFYDLYWEIKRAADHKQMDAIYMRVGDIRLAAVVRRIEATALKQALRALAAKDS